MNNYYYNIMNKLLNSINDNKHILLYIHSYYNPLEDFNHIIKKKSLNLYFIINNKSIYNKLNENIQYEENENKIHLYNNINDINLNQINNIKLDYIVIFHLYSLSYLENILNELNILINTETNIYIYCSLSNENMDIINYKNLIRNNIKRFIDYNFGNLLYFSDIIDSIHNLKYKINKISLYKKNHYIIYGDNKVYQLIIVKNK
jgi:hypothetical protein